MCSRRTGQRNRDSTGKYSSRHRFLGIACLLVINRRCSHGNEVGITSAVKLPHPSKIKRTSLWATGRIRGKIRTGGDADPQSYDTDSILRPLWLRGGAETVIDGPELESIRSASIRNSSLEGDAHTIDTSHSSQQEKPRMQAEEIDNNVGDSGKNEAITGSHTEFSDRGDATQDSIKDKVEVKEEDLREDAHSEDVEEGQEDKADEQSTYGLSVDGRESLVETMQLGKVIPAMIKQGFVFALGTWVANKLNPSVEGQVRAARVIYTAYLIFSQAVCMYLRYLIWKRNDTSEMELPPPPQLKKMMDGATSGIGGVSKGGGREEANTGAEGSSSSLAPMMSKMLTSKTMVKKYDMRIVQGMRRAQFWSSLFMCYTHLKRGMIKPMILQVSFGLLTLLDSPVFKIHVMGCEPEGDLARPFKKQGLMSTLSGPMEDLAAKAEQVKVATSAAETNKHNIDANEERTKTSSRADKLDDESIGLDVDIDPSIELLSEETENDVDVHR